MYLDNRPRTRMGRLVCRMRFVNARSKFHRRLLNGPLRAWGGVPPIADPANKTSVAIACAILHKIGPSLKVARAPTRRFSNEFKGACHDFLRGALKELDYLRPGKWRVLQLPPQSNRSFIRPIELYAHLSNLARLCTENAELAHLAGSGHLICPDIVVARDLEEDEEINAPKLLIDDTVARRASLRKTNGGKSMIHASISCKWTIRSDRVQNSRAEALNLIRNRKGSVPHIVVVTAEPLPSRLASIALGTGDLDFVYHFALPELVQSVEELQLDDAMESLKIMLEGKRLRDVSDLPLDLAI
jgi:hypothetical protein